MGAASTTGDITLGAAVLALLFAALAGIHLYWIAGGRFGTGVVLPSATPGGAPLFRPTTSSKAAVAAALLVAALLSASAALHWFNDGAQRWIAIAHLGLALLFCLRAIGDFRYLGLFKKITTTAFARWDNRLFVPLSFAISLLCGWVGAHHFLQ